MISNKYIEDTLRDKGLLNDWFGIEESHRPEWRSCLADEDIFEGYVQTTVDFLGKLADKGQVVEMTDKNIIRTFCYIVLASEDAAKLPESSQFDLNKHGNEYFIQFWKADLDESELIEFEIE